MRRYLASIIMVLIFPTLVAAQQPAPFSDLPVTDNFSSAEIAARGKPQERQLTYAPWRKLCFKSATQESGAKMVCRTTINGKLETGQVLVRLDLVEREGDPVKRMQIFVAAGSFLQPGIKLTVDQGTTVQIPYVICLTNACIAGSVATDGLIEDMKKGQTLALETVNFNLVGVITPLPLKEFAEVQAGPPSQIFEQRLEGDSKQ